MCESAVRLAYELAPETQARMAVVFAGRACCRCGEPAARVARARFYCAAHYERRQPHAASPPRVYRCAVAADR